MIRVYMVVASSESLAARVFIGCEDMAHEFGAFLQENGWTVRIESEIDPRTQPRLKEEEDAAGALIAAFEQWKAGAQGVRA